MYSEKHCIVTIKGEDTIVEGRCLLSDKLHKVYAKTDDYERWIKGEEDIKNLMPYLSKSDMNFLEHGVTDEGWEQVTAPKISIPKAQ